MRLDQDGGPCKRLRGGGSESKKRPTKEQEVAVTLSFVSRPCALRIANFGDCMVVRFPA